MIQKSVRHTIVYNCSWLRERIEQFKTMLQELAETNIAIVSHSAYLNQFLYGTLGDESNPLKHCHPYQLEME